MTQTEKNILFNRYPGVKPFSEKEQFLFFGRESDLGDLESLLFIKQAVVLYGKSGYGKSSLINAGIIPRLKEKATWTYFSIRFNNYSERETEQNLSPFETVKQRFAEKTSISKGNLFHKLMLDENSFWYWIKVNQKENKNSKIFIFFDQFEELFTYPKEQVSEFSEQLSQLLYSTIPAKFLKHLANLDEKNSLPEELYEFLYEKPEVKVLFSIRSDRLALMNKLTDRHPTILQNCFELDALEKAQAKAAIVEPARLSVSLGFKTPPFEYTAGAVKKILKSIADPDEGKIETAALQIICKYVEDTLVSEKKLTLISEDDLPNITDIFQQYYRAVIMRLHPDERLKAQHLIEDELIEGGRRNPLSTTYVQNKFNFSESLLQQLEATSILRMEQDAAGRVLIELSHDALIIPVAEARKIRLAAEDMERFIHETEAKKKLETEIQLIQKARELGSVEKKGFQLKESETIKRDYKIFRINAGLMANKRSLRLGLKIMLFALVVLFSLVWSGIATYKFISKGNTIKKRGKMLEETNSKLQNIIQTYDSLANPAGYHQLEDLLEQYKKIQPH